MIELKEAKKIFEDMLNDTKNFVKSINEKSAKEPKMDFVLVNEKRYGEANCLILVYVSKNKLKYDTFVSRLRSEIERGEKII